MAAPAYIQLVPQGVLLALKAQPNASRTAFAGEHHGRLKLKISSPPVDGKANQEICKFLANSFGLSKSRVQIVRGESSRDKEILLRGASGAEVLKMIRAEEAS